LGKGEKLILPRIPTSERGKATHDRIIEKSIELFKENGYQEVSAAMISKTCGIGNASFYQYFSSKEEILDQIVHDLTICINQDVTNAMSGVKVADDHEKLQIFIKTFIKSISNKINEYSVFRNAEFLFPEISKAFYDSLYKFLADEFFDMEKDSKTKRAFYLFVIGIVNFLVMEYGTSKNEQIDDKIADKAFDLIFYGIDPDNHRINEEAFEFLPKVEGEKIEFRSQWSITHKKILEASEQLFGKKGYSRSKISDISNLADVGLGTFYVHFDSKIEALRELVSSTLENLKANLRRYVWRFTDRRDAEIAGYIGFLDFFKRHKEMYSIVREMEFVDSKTEIFYYSEISKSYMKPLESAFKNNEYRIFDPVLLSYMLMGIGHQAGLELLIERDADLNECSEYVKLMSQFLMHGFRGMEG
jgi:AcrR family transcriptional regulator